MNLCTAILLGLVPAAIMALHVVYLAWHRSQLIFKEEMSVKPQPNLRATWEGVKESQEAAFSLELMIPRYGIPGFLLTITPMLGYLFLIDLPSTLDIVVGEAIKFGAAGAYVYVLLTLGQRYFLRDISSGAAMWAVVTLVLGPLLAGVLACMWNPELNSKEWMRGSIFFLAGLAPRTVASMVEGTFRRLLASTTGSMVSSPRTMPITQIRGITQEIAERLAEEGIVDVVSLAMCEPIKLFRNTSYDLRQVLSWMDEALLIYFLPQNWQALENEGITGCIDLAWYHDAEKTTEDVKILADRVNLKPGILSQVIERLYYDSQVQLVWVLYQRSPAADDDDDDDGDPPETSPKPPKVPGSVPLAEEVNPLGPALVPALSATESPATSLVPPNPTRGTQTPAAP